MKKNNISFHIGSSSLLLIFVILSLVSFAVLSLSSAVADKKLTDKMVKKTTDYYEACNQAQDKLHTLDLYLSKLYESGVTKEEFFETAQDGTSFAITVSDYQTLEVDVTFLYPDTKEGPFYEITAWSLVNTNVPGSETTLPVFK